ncbi:competence type IV pilus ATPase ComGA [Lederbergia lenta]|uniref:Type II secretion system protein E n=1 Tax=Lederbergia lenta TaxID=1467 RepID=A0A2X4WB40_LEDLE|nr:competence type IV pilus ATPase ComGA [Lederbergia lenta]MCM3111443.1 GspE/PulE family protein [Lederbergia lenta]MEC2325171.1 competence type IV pilus ATPase ComGA [Lederbergia lenta]SQI56082.1 type II secretion system protein E [Lederbergia lenta]
MSIEKIADLLLKQAIQLTATDIHITPRKHNYHIQFRLHGLLTTIQSIPFQAGERLISHLKFMSSIDISEKRKPQSGSFELNLNNQLIALRISTLPTTLAKESLVIRILPQDHSFILEKMSLFPSTSPILKSFMLHAHGMLIFTGPTGSGKSTTMYAVAEHCAGTLNRRVVTLEDPVEKQSDMLLQVQLNDKAGITYSTGLKAILRHDPDVIIIGEIRDAETAHIAIRAALTGHLVLTSLHTRDAKGAIYRLLEFGVKLQDIEQTLIGIMAQRLIALLCPLCGESCSKFCTRRVAKRTGVYEILYGQALVGALEESKGGKEVYHYPLIKDLIRKGIALGYVPVEEYKHWVLEE